MKLIQTNNEIENLNNQIISKGLKVNKGLRKLVRAKRHQAMMADLLDIHADIEKADPYFGMDSMEKYDAMKKAQKREQDQFDTSPCPVNERVSFKVGELEEGDKVSVELIERFLEMV